MTLQTISFATIAKAGLDRIDDGDALAFGEISGLRNSLLPWDRNFYALLGDGDDQFEFGETAHKLGDLGPLGRVQGAAASATADDPVTITAHGYLRSGAIGDLSDALVFRDGAFGLDSGHNGLLRAGYLDAGDSLTFDTKDQPITSISFKADLLPGRGTGALLFDLDGDVINAPAIRTGPAVEDALFRLDGIRDGDAVKLDFASHAILVNGAARAVDASALFNAFDAGSGNRVTIGAHVGRPVALDHVVIETESGADPAGTAVLTSSAGSPFSFGTVLHGYPGTTTIVITNTGDAAASNIEVTFGGPWSYNTYNPSLHGELPEEISAGQSADFNVQFNAPVVPGDYTGSADISYFNGHETAALHWDFLGNSL